MLLAAASCVPAILLLVYIWLKILELNYNKTLGDRHTVDTNYNVHIFVKLLLKGVPVFGLAVFAILVIGERNFFSRQVKWQTEPFSSIGISALFYNLYRLILLIGQWAPIVGTGLAVLGSLYVLVIGDLATLKKPTNETIEIRPSGYDESPISREQYPPSDLQGDGGHSPSEEGTRSIRDGHTESPSREQLPNLEGREKSPSRTASGPTVTPAEFSEKMPSTGQMSPIDEQYAEHDPHSKRSRFANVSKKLAKGGKKLAKGIEAASDYISISAGEHFQDPQFRDEAEKYPEIPGEEMRNPELARMQREYSRHRDKSPHRGEHHRTTSMTPSIASDQGIEGSSSVRRTASPRKQPSSPSQREHPSTDPNSPPLSPVRVSRRDTLTVPGVQPSAPRRDSISTPITDENVPEGLSSPAIVVSSDPFTVSPEEEKPEDHPT
jgi:hypothetical protein